MKLGALDIADVKLGITQVSTIMLGSLVVWEKPVVFKPFRMATSFSSSSSSACFESQSTTRYHNSSTDNPIIGDTISGDTSGSPFNLEGDQWMWKNFDNDTRISGGSDGIVTILENC